MSSPITISPFANATEAQLKQILSDAERVLDTQLTVGIASDQRALVFSGFIAAAVVALTGGAAAILIGMDHHFIGYLALAAGLGLLISLAYAVLSARPTGFEWAGGEPDTWHEDIATKMPLAESMKEQCQHYQDMIVTNRAILKFNNKLIINAQVITLIVLATTGALFLLYSIFLLPSASCANAGNLMLVAAAS